MELNDNFWKWFAGSKVVDKQGKPLVVYHGTNKSFNSFDKLKRGSVTSAKSSMDGFWFTTDKNLAGSYANLADYKSELSTLKRELKRLRNFPLANFKKEDEIEERIKELEKINTDNKHIISVYLKIENPKIIDAKGQIYNDFEENINQAIYNMNGYDGLIVKNLIDVGEDENPSDFKPSTHYMVLSSNQIKSVDNKGTWSNSNNIYEEYKKTNGTLEDYKNLGKIKIELPKYTVNKTEGVFGLATENGVIEIGKKAEKIDFDHEIAHQLSNGNKELAIAIMSNYGDAFGRFNIDTMKFEGIGNSPEESFAHAYSLYINYPEKLKEHYPNAFKAIEYILSNITNLKEVQNKFYKAYKINEEEYKYVDNIEVLKLSPSDDMKVYRNFAKDYETLRALIVGEDIYLWDAKQLTHDQVADSLFGEDFELDNQFMFDTRFKQLDDYSVRNTIDMVKFDKGTKLAEQWYNDFFKYYEIIKNRLGVDFTKEGLEKVEYLKSLKSSNIYETLNKELEKYL